MTKQEKIEQLEADKERLEKEVSELESLAYTVEKTSLYGDEEKIPYQTLWVRQQGNIASLQNDVERLERENKKVWFVLREHLGHSVKDFFQSGEGKVLGRVSEE